MGRLNPPSPPHVLERPTYFIFMGYLRQMRSNPQSEPLFYTYEPPFSEILDPPLHLYYLTFRLL